VRSEGAVNVSRLADRPIDGVPPCERAQPERCLPDGRSSDVR
jgi:hypothetical protein